MKKYEVLEHKADLKIRAFGRTKEEVFLNMLLSMSESMRPEAEKGGDQVKREIKIVSPDFPSLLVDFLSEILYLSQVNREVYDGVKFRKFSNTEIEAEVQGKKVAAFGQDIKAVTYHNLDIHQEKDSTWQATVLFDI